MRKFIPFLFILVLANPVVASRGGDQGYGIMVGNPSGLSAKLWMDEHWGLDAAVGVARSEFDVHLTLLRHNFSWVNRIHNKWGWFERMTSNGDLPFYYGIGPRLLFEDDEELGIRLPVGFSYLPKLNNWEIFTEFAPVIRTTPDFGFNGDFALGVRYYFRTIRPRVQGTP